LDLTGYDAVVVQEGWSSSAAIYSPTGPLGLANIPVPFVYNKVYAMKDGRGFQNGAAGSGGEVEGTLSIKVSSDNQSNPLFNGITFDADSVKLFDSGADDDGGDTRTKGMQYATDVVISADNTLLASGTNDPANATVCINDIPAGSMIGSETLQARMISIPNNTGAINKDMGKNFTQAGITLWRNAIYLAAGLEVPTQPVDIPTAINEVASKAPDVMVYPNPAINYAKVKFNLAQKQAVSLNLYNLMGQKIEIQNKKIMMSGTNEITINTSSLDRGFYIYQLNIGAKSLTGKLSVTK